MISIWLTPAAKDKKELAAIIADLAAHFDTPKFEPHITVATSPATPDEIKEPLRVALRKTRVVRMDACQIGYSTNFTNSLYISMNASHYYASLVRAVQESHSDLLLPKNEPRLSLLYRANEEAFKRKIAQSFEVNGKTYEFNAIKVVQMHHPVESIRDVASWRIKANIPLLPREARG
jgi:hypothetical protein